MQALRMLVQLDLAAISFCMHPVPFHVLQESVGLITMQFLLFGIYDQATSEENEYK